MSNRLPITGEYPADWPEINRRACESVGYRCIRCGHPYRKGEHGKGEWSPCDDKCAHGGPLAITLVGNNHAALGEEWTAKRAVDHWSGTSVSVVAQWRILTVHHLDGNKANCSWWNLLVLCQRCHLTVQGNVKPEVPYFLEHSAWFQPYVAGFYANKYEGREITREEAAARLDELLAYERMA